MTDEPRTPELHMEQGVICRECVAIHGRDTNTPIRCPYCGEIIGCFWHCHGISKHLKGCKAKAERGKEL
jgi:uncharacterized C2H2 Zn-finger protein